MNASIYIRWIQTKKRYGAAIIPFSKSISTHNNVTIAQLDHRLIYVAQPHTKNNVAGFIRLGQIADIIDEIVSSI